MSDLRIARCNGHIGSTQRDSAIGEIFGGANVALIRLGSPFVLFVGVPFDLRLAPFFVLVSRAIRAWSLGLGDSDRSRSMK